MARFQIKDVALRASSGRLSALPGATIGVYTALADTVDSSAVAAQQLASGTLATVYANPSGTATLPNPQTADSSGLYDGWLDDTGSYDIVESYAGLPPTFRRHRPGGSGGSVDLSSLGVYAVEEFGNILTAPVAAYESCLTAIRADGNGGIAQFPDVDTTAEKLMYAASGWGAAWAVSDSNIYLRGAGEGATILRSNFTGAGTVVDFLGYSASSSLASWASNRFPSLTLRVLDPSHSYAVGDQTFTFLTAGTAANFTAGDPVMLVTGQVDLVSVAGRGLQPDSVYGIVQSVNTGANTITLTEGIPKPLAPQYFTDNTTSQASTLTSSAFQAPFGIYNLRGKLIQNVGVSDLTMVCAATSRPAMAAHAVIGLRAERLAMRSASAGGLATFVCQEFSQGVFRDITMDTWGSVGYWGTAMCTDDVLIERIRHTHRTDVAYALNNEGISRVTFRDIEQISAKGATTGLGSFALGITYDCDVDGLRIHNAGPASALQILQNQPAPYVGGDGRIRNVKMTGSIANYGYIRGNWTVGPNVPNSIKLYGPPDDPTTAASAAMPSNQSSRKPKSIQIIDGVFNYNQAGGRVYLGRIPVGAWIWPADVDVLTAFDAGTTLAISVRNPATGVDTDHWLANSIDVTSVGPKPTTLANGHNKQTANQEYDVYVNLHTGTPTAGQAYVVVRWFPGLALA